MPEEIDRRPITARTTWWAQSLASWLVRAGCNANQISVCSIVFAMGGAAVYTIAAADTSPPITITCFLSAAACIQLRLLCNMLDGMIAVEGGKQSKLGAVFNELPDRIADSLFLVTAGYAAQAGTLGIQLGWAAGLLAVLTAYIRAFGASQGLRNDFSGPMAKPHRMFILTMFSLLASLEAWQGWQRRGLTGGLAIIVIGAAITCIRRTLRMVKAIENQGA